MNKKDINQVQFGDYFLYHGETVKVTGRSPYNESYCTVENKNGSKFYADVEELEPIVINEYTLEQVGIHKDERYKTIFKYKGIWISYIDGSVWSIRQPFGKVAMEIKYLHILQNALRLFGEEVEIK